MLSTHAHAHARTYVRLSTHFIKADAMQRNFPSSPTRRFFLARSASGRRRRQLRRALLEPRAWSASAKSAMLLISLNRRLSAMFFISQLLACLGCVDMQVRRQSSSMKQA